MDRLTTGRVKTSPVVSLITQHHEYQPPSSADNRAAT